MSAYTIALANGQHPPFPMSFLCSAANDCGYGGLYETPEIPPLETTEKHHSRQYATWNMAWNGIVFPVVLMFEQPEALAYTRALFREPQHARLLIKSYNVNKLLRQFSQYQIFYLQMKSSEFNNISEENPKCCIQIARGIRRSQCSLAHTHTHTQCILFVVTYGKSGLRRTFLPQHKMDVKGENSSRHFASTHICHLMYVSVHGHHQRHSTGDRQRILASCSQWKSRSDNGKYVHRTHIKPKAPAIVSICYLFVRRMLKLHDSVWRWMNLHGIRFSCKYLCVLYYTARIAHLH